MPIRAFKLDNITHQMNVEDVDRHAVNAFKRVLKLESKKEVFIKEIESEEKTMRVRE